MYISSRQKRDGCIYLYIHMNISIYIYIYIYMHTYIHMYTYTYIYIHIHMCITISNHLCMYIDLILKHHMSMTSPWLSYMSGCVSSINCPLLLAIPAGCNVKNLHMWRYSNIVGYIPITCPGYVLVVFLQETFHLSYEFISGKIHIIH